MKCSALFNDIEQEIHDSIIKLDQKLRCLLLEIQTKEQTLVNKLDSESLNHQEHLSVLSKEVNKALMGMEELVNLVMNEEVASRVKHENQDDLTEFRDMLIENSNKISALEDKYLKNT